MDIKVNVPDGVSGDWCVKTFEISEQAAKFEAMRDAINGRGGRSPSAGEYKGLFYRSEVVMSNTPAEIRDHLSFIYEAKKCENVLINGLGLGVALAEILKSDVVKRVDVIEISEDVIALSGPTYSKDSRVNIICADALEHKPEKGMRYGAVWHDIWPNICSDNLKEMKKLHRKYGRRCDWQGSWCRYECENARSRGY